MNFKLCLNRVFSLCYSKATILGRAKNRLRAFSIGIYSLYLCRALMGIQSKRSMEQISKPAR